MKYADWNGSQELYQPAIAKLVDFAVAAYQERPEVHLEVFVHKADTLSEEYKIGMLIAHFDINCA